MFEKFFDLLNILDNFKSNISQLSLQEITKEIFFEIDLERKGFYTKDDIIKFSSSRIPSISLQEASFIFNLLNTNQRDKISLHEFLVEMTSV